MLEFPNFVLGLASIGVAGFVAWTIRAIACLRADLAAVQLKMAENYAPNSDLHELKHQLEKVDDKVDSMLKMLYEIRARSSFATEA